MPMNRIQFQPGVSLPEFFERYGSEAQCEAALTALRWPEGFRCPRCASAAHYVVTQGSRRLFQCRQCRHQTSLTAGTLLDSTKLPVWLRFMTNQVKTCAACADPRTRKNTKGNAEQNSIQQCRLGNGGQWGHPLPAAVNRREQNPERVTGAGHRVGS